MLRRIFGGHNELEWTLIPKVYPKERKEHHSGKILLPLLCLEVLLNKQVEMPYIFKISAHGGISYTHTGVHEFTDDIQDTVLPQWMYDQLALDSSPVEVSCTTLPKGTFIRLLPQSKDFLELEDPKRCLEDALRNYQVLSTGDTISLYFEEEFKQILFTVSEIRPNGEGISIIDTDLEVDFLPPVDYEAEVPAEEPNLLVQTEGGVHLADPYFNHAEGLGVVFLPSPGTVQP
ncbi:ubiquitin fusion degradation protein 1 [Nematocida displodere]|uniref:Ubiquitin fusion degradation protein 1 n=1 Tax=Nematocida displodere TaxID=1805483 RepID=A0A177EBR8_9MICR|nr:ubiquitin fusion degradation protein 1 [Nematocida displodere]